MNNRKSKDYLKNARIIAKMINESNKQVMAYWFFTPFTIPDKKLLSLLKPDRHQIALHVARNPFEEWKGLEKETGRTIKFYTIHGTSKLLSQLLWKRKIGLKQAEIPSDFPLKSFHEFTTTSLDTRRYEIGFEKVKEEAQQWINQGIVISLHPEWLFKRGEKNRRGPCYDALKNILDVDQTLETLRIRKKGLVRIVHDNREYEKNIIPTEALIEKLVERDIDIFTFLDRKWCCPILEPASAWIGVEDNVGLLEIKSYDTWWSNIGKKTRNMVRRAEKNGVKVTITDPSEKLAEGIWTIFNETPIRQERAFPHYGESLQTVSGNMYAANNSTFIGAFLGDEIIGFIQMLHGEGVSVISNILSLQKHWNKAINNAMLAKAVENCASKGERWLIYGRIGNHPSLDKFKENNGFVRFPIKRYFVPITSKGRLAVHLGLHREFKDVIPKPLKYLLIPIFKWASRNKMRLKLNSSK